MKPKANMKNLLKKPSVQQRPKKQQGQKIEVSRKQLESMQKNFNRLLEKQPKRKR